MNTVLSIFKKSVVYSTVLVLTAFSPLVVTTSSSVAAEGEDTPPCVAPDDSTYGNGVHHPTGAAAGTYTYSCDSGLWSNAHYSYDPASNTYSPTFARNYSYDCATGVWTMDTWNYSPTDGAYHFSRVTTDNPGLATNCPVAPAADPPSSPAASTGSSGGSAASGSGSSGISNTGPGSSNSTNNNITLNNSTTTNNNLLMSNGMFMQAGTGNASVSNNTSGGNATSGNAQSIANIANILQSSTNAFGPNTTIFTANINGDVTGDFMFDPDATVSNTGPGSSNNANNTLLVNTNNTNNTDASITNDIDVGADSGNATVSGNTKGGDATSGDAQAVVNLMNLINSTVSSGKSFIGTININGNLNGDILLPQNLIDQLIASSGPGSSNNANTNVTDNSQTTNNTTASVDNNVDTSAQTGNANVSNNTNGGTASSGNAQTNITLLNLTGSNTFGKNNILVFVNVLGTWVGLIMNAPQGSTAASLGGGILNTGPGSQNATNTNVTDNSTLTNTANLGITNNVNAHATSGDASVTGNTTGGNATSGDAMTAVNILNMIGSNLNLSDWFGILFINVFGNWFGSFGVNTAAGNPVVATPAASTGTESGDPVQAAAPVFAAFVPKTPGFTGTGSASGSATGTSSDATNTNAVLASVLGSQTSKQAAKTYPSVDSKTRPDYTLPIIGASIAILMLAGERIVTIRKNHRA